MKSADISLLAVVLVAFLILTACLFFRSASPLQKPKAPIQSAEPATSAPQSTEPPTQPEDGVTLEAAQSQAPYSPIPQWSQVKTELSWAGVNGAVKYRVFRMHGMVPELVAETTSTVFAPSGSDRNTGTCFAVAAVNGYGVLSDLSEQACVK